MSSSSAETSGLRASCAEAIGTFVLVFAGTGAIVVDSISRGAVTHVGVALVFGLVVLALVSALGDVSGAHLNPAVSIAFAASGRFHWRSVPAYVGGQLAGAFAASLLLTALFPAHPTLGATLPAGSELQSFVLEVVLTWILMLVILSVSHGSHERGALAAIAVGSVVGLEALGRNDKKTAGMEARGGSVGWGKSWCLPGAAQANERARREPTARRAEVRRRAREAHEARVKPE